LGAETLIVQTDVSEVTDVENLAKKTIEHFGEVHLLVNNAGVEHYGTVWESSLDDLEWVVGVNLWGVIYGVRAFIPIMLKQTSKCHIINVSSMSGVIAGRGRMSSYSLTKQGVVGLSEALYYELSQYAPHIKMSVYISGIVNTDIHGCERSRPERFKSSTTPWQITDEETTAWEANLKDGLTIEESANLVFEGIRADKLYVGIRGFEHQLDGWFLNMMRTRTENILDACNPAIPYGSDDFG
jgi:short-subunit dehydrogenase